MNEKHTPGPWAVSSSLYVVSPLARMVAKCDGMGIADLEVPPEQMFANARLIAAAPDLLTAAKDALAKLEELRFQQDTEDEADVLRAAITKATTEGAP